MINVERAAVSGLKASALARLAGQLASWASTLVVVRLLTPDDYGLMALVAMLTGVGAAVAEFGLTASLIQAQQLERSTLQRLAGIVWLLHIAMAILMLIAGPLAA